MQTRKCHVDADADANANADANADANRIRTKNNMSPSPSVGDIIRSLKDNSKHSQRDSKNNMKQTQYWRPKLSQFYHMLFGAVEIWQSRSFELTVYFAQKAAAETAIVNINFRSI